MTPAFAEVPNCTNCYQEGLDARQRGELENATFSDVHSSCGMLQLTLAFGSAAASVRQCLGDSDTRRVTLVAEDGRIASSSVEPDDSVGRCVISALGRAHIEGLSCRLEASISR